MRIFSRTHGDLLALFSGLLLLLLTLSNCQADGLYEKELLRRSKLRLRDADHPLRPRASSGGQPSTFTLALPATATYGGCGTYEGGSSEFAAKVSTDGNSAVLECYENFISNTEGDTFPTCLYNVQTGALLPKNGKIDPSCPSVA